jgi:hypothetical protein
MLEYPTSLSQKNPVVTSPAMHNTDEIRNRLAGIAMTLAAEKRDVLDNMKAEHDQLERADFLWHYLLQSFATMGRASGWRGLIGNKDNYNKLRYETLAALSLSKRAMQVEQTCKAAKIRMPGVKARYILQCFEQVKTLGGPEGAKNRLLAQPGRDAKIQFLKSFSGIGDKYARNIMMDVYHEDFRESIAIDARIKALSQRLALSFRSYTEHEQFYLQIARKAGLNGWELDRLVFNFPDRFLPLSITVADQVEDERQEQSTLRPMLRLLM